MTLTGWLQIGLLFLIVASLVKPLGLFMASVFTGERTFLSPALGPVERGLYAAAGVDPEAEQGWLAYALSMLAFSVAGLAALYAILRLQLYLPLNPQGFAGMAPDLAFNTAVSFVTNTNWQSYGGETTLSHFSQMAGLTAQNFVSAAAGIAMALALTRAFARSGARTIGNFWVDLTRATLYVLLPLAIVVALAFVAMGLPQTLEASATATTLEGARQAIALGPIASQEAIKQLGTNGGGFLNANAAHPFENATALSNYLNIVAMLGVSAALVYAFGQMVGDRRQGWAFLAATGALLLAGTGAVYWAEAAGNPIHIALGVDPALGNMEGKEVRFGQAMTAAYAAVTTGLSDGGVNATHGSLTGLGGLAPMFLMQLGEVLPGGVGSGLYGMVVFAILAVFVAGLMVGRTPELLGKKIEAREMKYAMLAVLILPLAILGFTAVSAMLPFAVAGVGTAGPHGLSEILYGYTSAAGNNGGLRRADGQHALVQHDARPGDAAGALRLCRAGAGHRRIDRRQDACPGLRRHVPDDHAAVRRPADRRHPDHGRPAILPRSGARPHRRASRDAGRPDLLRRIMPRPAAITHRLFDAAILLPALRAAFVKLDPRKLMRNPVIFVTEVVAALVTVFFLRDLIVGNGDAPFSGQIAVWLWFTVLFATFAEAVAEGRGKAQADSLRRARSQLTARKLLKADGMDVAEVAAGDLKVGDLVIVEAGELVPGDGEVVEGVASVNESAVTGESAPVIREAGGDRSAVTGGTEVLSDRLKIRITVAPGSGFVDRMIALIEGAERQKTPSEVALSILLSGLTLIFLIAVTTLWGLAGYSGTVLTVTVLAALLVTLIPTTIGGLLSAIGIAGMDRLVRFNVIATSGRAVEAAGDVDTLLLDKTGTITFGNRMATDFLPVAGVTQVELAEAALRASMADETPEGRSIVALATGEFGLKAPATEAETIVPFTAETRLSGVDVEGRALRKGAVDAALKFAGIEPGQAPAAFRQSVDAVARTGGTPLAVVDGGKLLGVIHLKDVVKPGIKERFAALRAMGIRTVMVTGDNPVTAAAIASEAGVDDFIAEATPEQKLAYIRKAQEGGRLIAMCGDGSNDAPALAQADVGVAMQSGTQAAREAANMVDLDSSPTKLIEIVEIGKQLLMTRGSLTTFSIANDVAKYFAIIPALFLTTYPALSALNVMGLASPQSAILSAVIFNALIIVALIPLALKGVAYRPIGAAALLRRNLLVYGLGGLVLPFAGIKLVDIAVSTLHLV